MFCLLTQVVVIIVIWIISLLVIYMLFLVCLDPLLNKKSQLPYQEQNNEEVIHTSHRLFLFLSYFDSILSFQDEGRNAQPLRTSGTGVLNRVGHQQDKWKRQVQEQRRHIYDRHTILN